MDDMIDSPILIRLGAMGDMIMLLPALKYLHAKYGQKPTLICKGSWNHLLFDRMPFIKRVVPVARTKVPAAMWGHRRRWSSFRSLPVEHAAVYVGAKPDRYLRQLLTWIGIRDQQVCWVTSLQRQYQEHDSHFYGRLCQLNAPALDAWPSPPLPAKLTNEISPLPEEIQQGARWIRRRGLLQKKVVLVQIGNKKTMRLAWSYRRRSNVKHWPTEYWQATLDRLAELHPDVVFVLTGTSHERRLLDEVKRGCKSSSILNSAGDLPLSLLIGVMHHAHSMISVDTGPAHLAAAVGCPLTVLFTATNSYAFGPISNGSQVNLLRYERSSHHDGNPDDLVPARVVESHHEILSGELAAVA